MTATAEKMTRHAVPRPSIFVACAFAAATAQAQGHVITWGEWVADSRVAGESFVEVAAGAGHNVARRGDGSVVAWGGNPYGACNVPALQTGLAYVEVAAGGAHTAARRSDGSVVAWGRNDFGQCNVPALPPGLTYVEV